MSRSKLFITSLLTLVSQIALSQYAIDSLSMDSNLTGWYDQQVGLQNTVLQHGELITLTRKSNNSHAYYGNETWVDATITYCDQVFSDISILYNIEEDVLIIRNNLGASFAPYPLRLRKEMVSDFEIDSSHFKYISEPVSWHEGEFFKVVYSGSSIELLCKVFKKLEIKYGDPTYEPYYHYFLKKNGKYHRIKRLGHLLKLFPDHKKEIRQYRKQLSLRNIDNPENEKKFSLLVGYCDNF